MPRYFLHIRNRNGFTEDEERQDYQAPDLPERRR
jgi:hypothetical protein